jgi:nicotinate-nucleotide adenylyltransferase
MKVGLFFGSFNPVHIGHLIIADYIVEFTDLNQLWFVISPQNPLKKKSALLEDHKRRTLLEIAIEGDDRFRICDIEFKLPVPSYTIDTLVNLKERYPGNEFILIMGYDTLLTFHKWKNHAVIEENYKRYVYPRSGYEGEISENLNIRLINAPRIDISSTFIRRAIAAKHDIRHFLPQKVFEYITEMHYYEK